MNKENLEISIIEARRFLKKALELHNKYNHFYTSKDTASVKRASMDLTRSLAQLRKPL